MEATDRRYRDLTAGKTLLHAMEERLAQIGNSPQEKEHRAEVLTEKTGTEVTILDQLDLDARLSSDDYDEQLEKYQRKLNQLAWRARDRRRTSRHVAA